MILFSSAEHFEQETIKSTFPTEQKTIQVICFSVFISSSN